MAKYLGMDMHIVQPPLPEGKGRLGELPGTDRWSKVLVQEYSSRTSMGWWDLRQDGTKDEELTERDTLLGNHVWAGNQEQVGTGYENWWPGFGRWRIGVKMEDATLMFDEGEHWN